MVLAVVLFTLSEPTFRIIGQLVFLQRTRKVFGLIFTVGYPRSLLIGDGDRISSSLLTLGSENTSETAGAQLELSLP